MPLSQAGFRFFYWSGQVRLVDRSRYCPSRLGRSRPLILTALKDNGWVRAKPGVPA